MAKAKKAKKPKKKKVTPKKKPARRAKPKAKPKAKAKAKAKTKAKAKPAKKKAVSKSGFTKPLPPPDIDGTLLGRIEDFFAHVNVIAFVLKAPLNVGDSIHIKGHTTDLIETVTSIQIEHESITNAKKGDSIGIKIAGIAQKKDWVFKVN